MARSWTVAWRALLGRPAVPGPGLLLCLLLPGLVAVSAIT